MTQDQKEVVHILIVFFTAIWAVFTLKGQIKELKFQLEESRAYNVCLASTIQRKNHEAANIKAQIQVFDFTEDNERNNH